MNFHDTSSFRVEPDEAGQRLDSCIAARIDNCSRSHAAMLIRQGHVRVDGQACKPGYRVKHSEHITIQFPKPTDSHVASEPLPLDILFEDKDLILVNKAAGMVVHPAAGHYTGTLVNGILHHCPDLEGIGTERRPGIVHRLDKDTSGILVVAKNNRTHQELSRQFKARSIQKRYLAIVMGSPEATSGRIDLPVGRHPVERKKMSTTADRSRDALTLWTMRERLPGASLLEIELKTGRTHQIRVHCQAMGYPIVGDPVYSLRGALKDLSNRNPSLYRVLKSAPRQMLHAFRISFDHPAGGGIVSFEAPMPADMDAVLEALRCLRK